MRYRGLLYRALNPIWARDPLSGAGARRFGGRFNAKGTPALYTSLSIATAIRESNQIGTLQPTTLVSYAADIAPVFDATDRLALADHAITPDTLAADDWRLQMQAHGKSATQAFAERLARAGFAGAKLPSYARGAGAGDLNIVLWKWGPDLPVRLVLNDVEGRLSR